MMMGRCCHCNNHRALTIKGLAIADGTTTWEYGPGTWWRHHYGSDAITGIVPDLGATLDKYVLGIPFSALSESSPVRTAFEPVANCAENVTLTKLNSLTGAVIESAVCEGLFSSYISADAYAYSPWLRVLEACGLSGGDYLIVGRRNPAIEFVAFASNTASKTYILHAHNMQAGNVTLTTRTSSESIVLVYNIAAAAVKTAFEATADCTAATVTGGPWPHRSMQVDATWSVSTGDIKTIAMAGTYVVGGLTTRSTYGTATSYDTGTGLITTSVGFVFGQDRGASPSQLIANPGVVPSTLAYATCEIGAIVAGPSDSVAVLPQRDLAVTNGEKFLDCFAVASPWARTWQLYTNVNSWHFGSYVGALNHSYDVQNGSVIICFANDVFTGGNRGAASVTMSAGVVTELETPTVSLLSTFNNDWHNSYLIDGSAATFTTTDYDVTESSIYYLRSKWTTHVDGSEVYANGDELLIGSIQHVGTNATHTFGFSTLGTTAIQYVAPAPSSTTSFYWKFFSKIHSRLKTGTQWRFRFTNTTSVKYSAWLNLYCTGGDVETAILGVFPTGTGVSAFPFGTPAAINNTNFAPLEVGLDLTLTVTGVPNSSSYWVIGRITIEFQTVTQININGIGAWSRSNAAILWQRTFGTTVDSVSIPFPRMAWLKGDFVYAAGDVVDTDF